jgi:hypothetical protein
VSVLFLEGVSSLWGMMNEEDNYPPHSRR